MLVLVSFALVLLATILLVVGLLSDDGLTLIYLSIASSFTAAVVLYLAFRLAKPKGEPGSTAPSPLADDIAPQEDAPTAVQPAVAATPAPVAAPAVEAEAPAAAEPAPAEADWSDDADWVDDDEWADDAPGVEFPIADYDDLKVGEIMPLLPQLYSDELPVVLERERAGKNRSTIVARLEELAVTGTEADRLEAEAAAEAPAAEAPAPAPVAPVSFADDEDADEVLFPIADYDDLTVAQILPLLPQLEADELEDVRAREISGAGRKSLLTEIDRHIAGVDDEPAAAPAPARRAAPALPIADYDDRTVAEIRPMLSDLSDEDLRLVLAHETATEGRKTIIDDVERRLGASAPAAAPRAAASKRPAKKASSAGRKAAKKATKKAAKKATRTRFPIANYDELTVAEIRPRLSSLSDNQLAQVRERELTGAGRKTILNDIDSRLG